MEQIVHGRAWFASAIAWSFLFSSFTACIDPDAARNVLVIGHGGMGATSDVPMDCATSLEQALAQGADGIELDVQMTRDCVLVAFHDMDLDALTPCHGMVNDHTWNELRSCTYLLDEGRSKIMPLHALEGIIATHRPKEMVFDVKVRTSGAWSTYLRAFAAELTKVVLDKHWTDIVRVECRTEEFLHVLGEAGPLRRSLYCDDIEAGIGIAVRSGLDGLTVHKRHASPDLVDRAHAAHLYVSLFGIGDRSTLHSALGSGPDAIQVDGLPAVLDLLERGAGR
ncbi:MAG: hypothetical protein H6594_02065 [Flavobacteriales bacterium]|nr:hypothetical protein [Flavobacteriales bacterium]